MFTLFQILTLFGSALAIGFIGEIIGLNVESLALLLIIGWVLFHLLPSLSVTVRRLHDAGYSGWFLLLNFIPYIGGLILFILTVMDSEPETNRWGPNPKNHNTETYDTEESNHFSDQAANDDINFE